MVFFYFSEKLKFMEFCFNAFYLLSYITISKLLLKITQSILKKKKKKKIYVVVMWNSSKKCANNEERKDFK